MKLNLTEEQVRRAVREGIRDAGGISDPSTKNVFEYFKEVYGRSPNTREIMAMM